MQSTTRRSEGSDCSPAMTRRNFLLGFHNRKQQRKVDYLTKKMLNEKKEHMMERIAVGVRESRHRRGNETS